MGTNGLPGPKGISGGPGPEGPKVSTIAHHFKTLIYLCLYSFSHLTRYLFHDGGLMQINNVMMTSYIHVISHKHDMRVVSVCVLPPGGVWN